MLSIETMTRSLKKGPFFDPIYPFQDQKEEFLWSRRSVILPQIVGQRVAVTNGKRYKPFLIEGDMVGHTFGEFANTRKKGVPKKKQKKKK